MFPQGSAVVVALTEPDSLFTYLLDIPVMKAGEVAFAQPTASGRYTYGSDGASLACRTRALPLSTARPPYSSQR